MLLLGLIYNKQNRKEKIVINLFFYMYNYNINDNYFILFFQFIMLFILYL